MTLCCNIHYSLHCSYIIIIHTAHRQTLIFFRLYHMHGTSVLYEFMKQPWWWSVASKLCEDKYSYRLSRSRLGHFLGRLVSVSSRTKNRTSRFRLVKFWWTSRLGLVSDAMLNVSVSDLKASFTSLQSDNIMTAIHLLTCCVFYCNVLHQSVKNVLCAKTWNFSDISGSFNVGNKRHSSSSRVRNYLAMK